jgi:hypothetical protein
VIETISVRTERPSNAVFEYLVDQANWPLMDPALVQLSPRGPLAVGQSGTMTRRVSRMRVTTSWEITELEPGSRLGMRITGKGYQLTETTAVVADGGGTTVTVVDMLVPTSLAGRAFVAMSGPFIRRDLRDRAARLASILDVPARLAAG